MEDYYQLLGVSRDATLEEIKKSHRDLVREIHPDRNPGDPDAEQNFMIVQQAYETLADPESRASYDKNRGPVDDKKYDVNQEGEAASLDQVMGALFGPRRQ